MRVLFMVVLSLSLPALAEAQVGGAVHQRVVGLVEPMGLEHSVAAGVRARLGDQEELIFTGAHAEAGVISYVSPIYANTGAYLEVSPFAFLVFRAELTSVSLWPIGSDGAGHFAVAGYDADVRSENLPAEQAVHADGWTFHASATLRGAVPIGPIRALLVSQLAFEHATLGDAPHYFSPRYDMVLAQQEWMIASSSMLLADIPLGCATSLRAGVYDDLRQVPRSGYVTNQFGALTALTLEEIDSAVPELTLFVRAGNYTHHSRREGGWTGLAGAMARYEIR